MQATRWLMPASRMRTRMIGFYSLQKPRARVRERSAAAERALAIDPDLPEAHTSLALVSLGDWNWPEAERLFARALELDPSQALARIYWSWLMVLQGDSAGAILQARKAQELEPLSPLVNGSVAHTLYLARRYDEAIAECEKSLEVDPNFILGIHVMGMCRALQGRLADAIEIGERAVSMSAPRTVLSRGAGPLLRAERRRRQGAGRLSRNSSVSPATDTSRLIASPTSMPGLNDLDRALDWEANAYDDGASPSITIHR